MLDPIGIIKIAETKGVAMTIDRFSKLYKESAVAKKLSRNFKQLFKSQKAVEANGNGTSGIKITEGVNQGKILGHNKTEAKKL